MPQMRHATTDDRAVAVTTAVTGRPIYEIREQAEGRRAACQVAVVFSGLSSRVANATLCSLLLLITCSSQDLWIDQEDVAHGQEGDDTRFDLIANRGATL